MKDIKKLFCIKDNQGKVYANAFFRHKMEAKEMRNALNEEGGKKSPYTVSYGVDHQLYKEK